MATRIQLRRDTAANWTSTNPTLSSGEVGVETDTGKFKLGDGSTAWASLSYFTTGSGAVATDTIWDAKGDLAVGTGANTAIRLAVGTTGQVLTADPGEASGLKFATPAGTGDMLAANNLSDLTNAATARANLGLGTAATTASTDYATAAQGATADAALPKIQVLNDQTGTTYTFVLADATKLVRASNAAAQTYTVPPNSSVAFSIGSQIDLEQLGAGQVTLAAGVGVTLNYTPSLKTRTQYSVITLKKTATDNWLVLGDLEPVGQSLNAQTGTTYTLVLADTDKLVTLSNAAAITMTVPPNSSVAFSTGTRIDLAQIGAGQVTVAAGAGVTVSSTPTLKARAQYSGMTLVKTGTDTWLLFGDLAAT